MNKIRNNSSTLPLSQVKKKLHNTQVINRRILIVSTIMSAVLLAVGMGQQAFADELPSGANIAAGAVAISTANKQLIINQSTPNAVINWSSFSIDSGNSVKINQPSSNSNLLNRVTGPFGSELDGSLSANGNIFLINPNGIVLGNNSAINTHSFTASTLEMSDVDFLSGHFKFQSNKSKSIIFNNKSPVVEADGYSALIGLVAENYVVPKVQLAKITTGTGKKIVVNSGGDGFLQFPIDMSNHANAAALNQIVDQQGNTQAAISMSALQSAARNTVNTTALDAADGAIVHHNQTIELSPAQSNISSTTLNSANSVDNQTLGLPIITAASTNVVNQTNATTGLVEANLAPVSIAVNNTLVANDTGSRVNVIGSAFDVERNAGLPKNTSGVPETGSALAIIPDPKKHSALVIIPDPKKYSALVTIPDPKKHSALVTIPDPKKYSALVVVSDRKNDGSNFNGMSSINAHGHLIAGNSDVSTENNNTSKENDRQLIKREMLSNNLNTLMRSATPHQQLGGEHFHPLAVQNNSLDQQHHHFRLNAAVLPALENDLDFLERNY